MSTTTAPAGAPLSLAATAATDRGKVRLENQDRLHRVRTPLGELFLVADGMGGHRGGARAAEMTVEGMARHLAAAEPGALLMSTAVADFLQSAAVRTNEEIYQEAIAGGPETEKMGATAVLALIAGRSGVIAHAGDSRAYLFRGGELTRLTRDHTPIQRLIEHHILTEEEARHHPHASVVSRGFGQMAPLELEVASPRELLAGDRLLLCSDGLSAHVVDGEIARVLGEGTSIETAARRLVELALAAGGEDNVSLHLIELTEPASRSGSPRLGGSWSRGPLWLLLLLALLVLIGVLAIVFF